MKKLTQIMTVILIVSISADAGFWSSALGTAAGSRSSHKSYYYEKDATKEPKKIQQTLSKLGFYHGKFNGNLNSFDTRSAIEEFQSYYNLEDSGVLTEMQKQDMLYMHDLIKNYKKELQDPKSEDSKRLLKLYKAFDKLEKKFSNNNLTRKYLSIKFKKEIKERRVFLAQQKQKKANKKAKWKNDRLKSMAVYKDPSTGLTWQDEKVNINSYKQKSLPNAKKYCANLILSGSSNWRLPTVNEFHSLYKKRHHLKYKFKKNYSYVRYYWTSSRKKLPMYFNMKTNRGNEIFSYSYYKDKNYVRCVRGRQ